MNRAVILIILAVVLTASVDLSAQRITGEYVVVDSVVVGRVDDASANATRLFRYNDTVRAVRRMEDNMLVKYRDLAYLLPASSMVRAKDFYRHQRSVAVVADSAEVRTEQSTIWVRKGAVLPFLGNESDDRLRVQIYGQPATMQAGDVLLLQADPNRKGTLEDDADEERRPFRIRPGVAFGACVPLSDVEYLDGGFSWAATLDVRLGGNNLFLTAGYSSSTITFEEWTGIIGSAQFEMIHAGVIVGLTAEMSTVVPYASLNLGLMTSDGDALLVGGLGLDYYTTSTLVAFVEAMPTFHIDTGNFFWLPVRVGLKMGL